MLKNKLHKKLQEIEDDNKELKRSIKKYNDIISESQEKFKQRDLFNKDKIKELKEYKQKYEEIINKSKKEYADMPY